MHGFWKKSIFHSFNFVKKKIFLNLQPQKFATHQGSLCRPPTLVSSSGLFLRKMEFLAKKGNWRSGLRGVDYRLALIFAGKRKWVLLRADFPANCFSRSFRFSCKTGKQLSWPAKELWPPIFAILRVFSTGREFLKSNGHSPEVDHWSRLLKVYISDQKEMVKLWGFLNRGLENRVTKRPILAIFCKTRQKPRPAEALFWAKGQENGQNWPIMVEGGAPHARAPGICSLTGKIAQGS